MQQFYINQNATLPTLAMELIFDGRHDYSKFFEAIQDADITFTMTNINTQVIKIANAPCYIKLRETDGCIEQYLVCYDWKKRDTKEKGSYVGVFNIEFKGNLKGETKSYPVGELIMPIREKLLIVVQ